MPAAFVLAPSDFAALCEVITAVTRKGGLPPDEADDFSQTVHLKLLERNYAPVRMFAGRSALRTYLTVIVGRLLLDWRNSRYGKWRPSACARRLGPAAVSLDRLISRDLCSVDEAVAILENRPGLPAAETLRALAEQLPRRSRIRTVRMDDVTPSLAPRFEDPVEVAEACAARQRALRVLQRAYVRLAPADQQLVRLRFRDNLSIAAIACLLGVPAKSLYRRMQRVLRTLGRDLARARGHACSHRERKRTKVGHDSTPIQ
jgi:RNA polymerase sigma factor (sigma-70 family)